MEGVNLRAAHLPGRGVTHFACLGAGLLIQCFLRDALDAVSMEGYSLYAPQAHTSHALPSAGKLALQARADT